MSATDKNDPLSALFAEAMSAVDKVETESKGIEQDDIEIEFVDSNAPTAEQEFEIEMDFDADVAVESDESMTNTDDGWAEREAQIADLESQLLKAKKIITKRKRKLQTMEEAAQATQKELFQQRAMVQRLKERLDRAESRSKNSSEALQATQSRFQQIQDALGQAQKQLIREQNLRKKENEEHRKYGIGPAMKKILPVIDNLELALKHAGSNAESILSGVEMSLQQFEAVFAKIGVHRIDASKGIHFNPERHEAISKIEDSGEEHNSIVEELRAGYVLNERLLRAARVSVAVDSTVDAGLAKTNEAKQMLNIDLELDLDESESSGSEPLQIEDEPKEESNTAEKQLE